MATLDRSLQSKSIPRLRERPAGSVRFDLSIALLALWFVIGLFVDGWAHNHGKVDSTFFTPYHALLYSGILATGLFLGISQYRNIGNGHSFSRALPYGYNLSLIGVALFFFGGGFDLIWHTLFGFEASMASLLSPSHLILATAGFLIMSGPLRSAWQRVNVAPTWATLLPVVIVLLLIICVLTFFTQFANQFSHAVGYVGRFPPGDHNLYDIVGIATVLFPATIVMGVLLFGLRRWTLPFGAITLILTVNALGMMLMEWRDYDSYPFLLAAPLIAGLVGDGLLRWLKPSTDNRFGLRVFAFAVPFVLETTYFVLLITQKGIWWVVHMWLGVSFFAAVIGVFLSYLTLPPALPSEGT
ncbi:MAG: hypothetical protein ABI700_32755 [Chloroflexota bacterium]